MRVAPTDGQVFQAQQGRPERACRFRAATLSVLEHTDYGTLEGAVTDLGGNRLRFGTDLEPYD